MKTFICTSCKKDIYKSYRHTHWLWKPSITKGVGEGEDIPTYCPHCNSMFTKVVINR